MTRLRYIIYLACLMLIAAATLYVTWRQNEPEWKAYQKKSFSLSIGKLEDQLRSEKAEDLRKITETEISTVASKQPEIIEIKPFNAKLPTERCLTCHLGIEDISGSHPSSVFGCVICHGGSGKDLTVKGAHAGLRGGRNPASLDSAPISCGTRNPEIGACHSDRPDPLLNRAENTLKGLMATNAGIIGILRFQWGVENSSHSKYAIKQVGDANTKLLEIPPEVDQNGTVQLSESHFRKFCAACHLHTDRQDGGFSRSAGCPACHGVYNDRGVYQGDDPTIKRDESGHVATHTLTNKIINDRCRSCHNRSARIGMNYQGEMESTQYGTPYVNGGLNPDQIDSRFYWKLVPDIHHEKKMVCIDCHTGQETMGDGKVHLYMKDQIEIRCEDCHGSPTALPAVMLVNKFDELTQTLIRTNNLKVAPGDVILKTSKGRPMPNVRLTEKGYILTGKLDGKERAVKIIAGKREAHSIKGHERLECDSCHSAWSPQCYGCHQVVDFKEKGKDHLTQKMSPGRWAEGRNYFRYERNILGINSVGRVGILVPGCQVWNSVVSNTGAPVPGYDSKIMRLKNGMSSIAVGSTHPHTTRTEVPRCVDCHLDPKVMGLGEGGFIGSKVSDFQAVYDSERSGLRLNFPLDGIISPEGEILQGTSHEKARGFNASEIKKIVGIAQCLPCHDKYDDPVWQKPGPYVLTPKCNEAVNKFEKNH